MIHASLATMFDLDQGTIPGASLVRRYLGDLPGAFADTPAYQEALSQGNPIVYTVSGVETAQGDGQLHYGLGVLMPGKIGSEYYLTKGHYHSWRAAAEVYVGLRGRGFLLLEDDHESRLCPLQANAVVYVPGHTAHRTINTGDEPLVYLGIYPAAAGHDYGAIAARNFSKVVVERDGNVVMLDRAAYRS